MEVPPPAAENPVVAAAEALAGVYRSAEAVAAAAMEAAPEALLRGAIAPPVLTAPFVGPREMERIQAAVRDVKAKELFKSRSFWYKPVALVGGRVVSIEEGTRLEYIIGKRMLCDQRHGEVRIHEEWEAAGLPSAPTDRRWGPAPRQKEAHGFLVFDCAARALQHAITHVTPGSRMRAAQHGVLRVRVKGEVAPKGVEWPTPKGAWAFRVCIPVDVAVERQGWMDDARQRGKWLPACPPGLCRACAMGKTCIQMRAKREVGAPPKPPPTLISPPPPTPSGRRKRRAGRSKPEALTQEFFV